MDISCLKSFKIFPFLSFLYVPTQGKLFRRNPKKKTLLEFSFDSNSNPPCIFCRKLFFNEHIDSPLFENLVNFLPFRSLQMNYGIDTYLTFKKIKLIISYIKVDIPSSIKSFILLLVASMIMVFWPRKIYDGNFILQKLLDEARALRVSQIMRYIFF